MNTSVYVYTLLVSKSTKFLLRAAKKNFTHFEAKEDKEANRQQALQGKDNTAAIFGQLMASTSAVVA